MLDKTTVETGMIEIKRDGGVTLQIPAEIEISKQNKLSYYCDTEEGWCEEQSVWLDLTDDEKNEVCERLYDLKKDWNDGNK